MLRRVAAGKRTSGRCSAQIASCQDLNHYRRKLTTIANSAASNNLLKIVTLRVLFNNYCDLANHITYYSGLFNCSEIVLLKLNRYTFAGITKQTISNIKAIIPIGRIG